jgi:hypothetical protein
MNVDHPRKKTKKQKNINFHSYRFLGNSDASLGFSVQKKIKKISG